MQKDSRSAEKGDCLPRDSPLLFSALCVLTCPYLVFIVDQDNEIDSLTEKQIVDIYSGVVDNFKDVGGSDKKNLMKNPKN